MIWELVGSPKECLLQGGVLYHYITLWAIWMGWVARQCGGWRRMDHSAPRQLKVGRCSGIRLLAPEIPLLGRSPGPISAWGLWASN